MMSLGESLCLTAIIAPIICLTPEQKALEEVIIESRERTEFSIVDSRSSRNSWLLEGKYCSENYCMQYRPGEFTVTYEKKL